MNNILNFLLQIPVTYAQVGTDVGNKVDEVGSKTGNQLAGLFTFIIDSLPLWITAFLVIVASFLLARLVKAAVEDRMTQEGFEDEHKEIQLVAGRTAHATVLIVGITVGLKIGGLDLTPIIAAGAFGIGFALQDLIMNFLAGVMILSARNYTIGDIISVNGTTGKIVEIQTRATIIKAFDGTKVIVPNSDLFKNKVTSKTSNPLRRIQLLMGVGYDADLKKTMKLTIKTLKTIPNILQSPKPNVVFYEWGDYSINFKINAWVDVKTGKYIKTKNNVILTLSEVYNNSGINIPFPIQTIQIDKEEEGNPTKPIPTNIAKVKKVKIPVTQIQSVQPTIPSVVSSAPEQIINTPQPIQPSAYPAANVNGNAAGWLQQAIAEQLQQIPQPSIPAVQQQQELQSVQQPQIFTPTQPEQPQVQFIQPQVEFIPQVEQTPNVQNQVFIDPNQPQQPIVQQAQPQDLNQTA